MSKIVVKLEIETELEGEDLHYIMQALSVDRHSSNSRITKYLRSWWYGSAIQMGNRPNAKVRPKIKHVRTEIVGITETSDKTES